MNIFDLFSRRSLTGLIAATGLISASVAAQQAAQAADRICFTNVAGVSNCIDGRFAQFWEQNGGLPVFGYPLTPARQEVNRDTGKTYLTQYFERQRFELHPENARPYDVLLGRLGDDSLRGHGRDWQSGAHASPNSAHYFAETGHAVGEQFWAYWQSHGLELGDGGVSQRESLALFGFPLTEPQFETNSSGDRVLTQYFERARVELHPEHHAVLQGRLGDEVRHDDNPHGTETARPSETEHPRETETAHPGETEHPRETETPHPAETEHPRETETAHPSATPGTDDGGHHGGGDDDGGHHGGDDGSGHH